MFNLFYKKAQAIVGGNKDYRSVKGKVTFVQKKDGVHINAEVFGLPDGGVYGFHVHEGKACTGNMTDPFSDSGMHYNPKNLPHPYHAGDMPPLFSENGRAYMSFVTNRFRLAEVLGRAIIIHSMPDDFTTQPSGNSGKKIACGIITADKKSLIME